MKQLHQADAFIARHPAITIILTSLVYLLWKFFYGNFGLNGFDDTFYMENAAQMASGKYPFLSDAFGWRWLPIFLLSISYKTIGVCDMSTAIPFIVIFILLLLTTYYLARDITNHYAAMLAVAFLLSYRWLVYYADKAMPDILLALIVTSIIRLYYRYRCRTEMVAWKAALGVAILLMAGVLTKELIAFMLPICLYLMVLDAPDQRQRAFWFHTVVFTVILFFVWLLSCYHLTGDPFYRWHILSANGPVNNCMYYGETTAVIMKRIGYEMWLSWIGSGAGLIVLGAMVSSVSVLWKKNDNDRGLGYLSVVFIMLVFMVIFGSVSLQFYSPLCSDVRHSFFILPAGAILSAHLFADFLRRKTAAIQVFIPLVLCFFCAYVAGFRSSWYLYLPVLLFCLLWSLSVVKQKLPFYYVCLLLPLLFAGPACTLYRESQHGYPIQKAKLKKLLALKKWQGCMIVCDALRNFYVYYAGYDPHPSLTPISFRRYNKALADTCETVYFLYSTYHHLLEGYNDHNLPAPLQQRHSFEKVYSDGEDFILYALDKACFPTHL